MVVRQATLSLYAWDATGRKGSTGSYGVYPMTRDWSETQITWALAVTGVSWTMPGGDFLPASDGTSPKQGTLVNVWYPFGCTARVQAWLAAPATNFGWCVRCTDENLNNQDRFYSGDTSSSPYRPKLVISDLITRVPGDINGDGTVDLLDLLALADVWGSTCGVDRNYDPQCDLNDDGSVDVVDLLTLADSWGM